MRWPWSRAPDSRPAATVEGPLRFRLAEPANPKALAAATRSGLRAAARAIARKGAVRVTADLEGDRLVHVQLAVRGPSADAALQANAARAFAKAFRLRYRGVFATRAAPTEEPVGNAGPDSTPNPDTSPAGL